MTPNVFAKAIIELGQEMEMQGRKEKKEKEDQKEEQQQQQTDLNVTDKKGSKKDGKKDDKKVDKKGKSEAVVEIQPQETQVKEVPEKDFKRNMDCLYYLIDIPKTEEEINEYVKASGDIDIILNVR